MTETHREFPGCVAWSFASFIQNVHLPRAASIRYNWVKGRDIGVFKLHCSHTVFSFVLLHPFSQPSASPSWTATWTFSFGSVSPFHFEPALGNNPDLEGANLFLCLKQSENSSGMFCHASAENCAGGSSTCQYLWNPLGRLGSFLSNLPASVLICNLCLCRIKQTSEEGSPSLQ